jgi:hypothetical protein
MNLLNTPWREALKGLDARSYHDLRKAFEAQAQKCKESGDSESEMSLKMFASLCTMYVKTETLIDPLGPMISGPEGRTLIPDDLTDEQISELEQLLPEIDNPWLLARVADTVWVRRRLRSVALRALDAYQILSQSDTEFHFEKSAIQIRSLTIAKAFDKPRFRLMINGLVDGFFETSSTSHEGALEIYRVLSRYLGWIDRIEDVYTVLCSLADDAMLAGNYPLARECWIAVRAWYRTRKRHDDVHTVTHRLAESFLTEEGLRLKAEEHTMVSDYYVRRALSEFMDLPKAYRNEHDLESKISDLRKELTVIGKEVVRSMGSVTSEPIDLSDLVRATESRLSGQPLDDVLGEYAVLGYRRTVEPTRELAKELVKEHPLLHIIGSSSYSSEGRIVAKSAPMDLNSRDSFLAAVDRETAKQFRLNLSLTVSGCLLPGLDIIQREHYISITMFQNLATSSILVPSDRISSWAEGLYHGYSGNFIVAALILIPQIEHWLRWLLQSAGHDTVVRKTDGTDEHMVLESLLADPVIKDMLEGALWYELNLYFLDPHGTNLRNEMLHGLVPDNEMRSTMLTSFWHLCLRIVMLSQPVSETPEQSISTVL